MTVFVKTISDLVALFLQALRLSVLLPASVFVGLNVALILPQLQTTHPFQALELNLEAVPVLVILALLVLFISYVLAVANIPLIRLFEGYPWLNSWLGSKMRHLNFQRVKYLQQMIRNLDEEARACNKAADADEAIANNETISISLESRKLIRRQAQNARVKAQKKQMRKNLFNAELSFLYPHHQPWRILPTRLGNVIASAEETPGHLYGIDAVTFWPYLSPILTKQGYAPYIEREKATFDFLLNMVIVTLLFGLELLYVDILLGQFAITYTSLKVLLTLALAMALYILSIQGALSWGHTIRTAYVLYRDQLRQQLKIKEPEGFYQERVMWKLATRFLLDHDVTPGNYIFDYESSEAGIQSSEILLKVTDANPVSEAHTST